MKHTLTPRTARHDHGHRNTHGLQVPLLSTGETHRGYFEVPKTAVTFKPHSNKLHSYTLAVREKVKVWVDWKAKQGWHLRGKPTLLVPVPKPFGYGEEAEEDTVRVYVQATFYRTKPLYVTLDDFLGRLDQYQRYNLAVPGEALTENPLPEAVSELVADGNRDGMQAAEQRRQALGLKRELIVKDGIVTGAEVVATSLPERDDAAESSTPR